MQLTSPRVQVEDTWEAVNDYLYAQGMTDGLPVVPPTPERVEAMVAGSSRRPEEVISLIPPLFREASVEAVAVNAVMAGCLPEYMPLVIAAVEAACQAAFNLNGLQATTNPVGPLIIVNGPVRKRLDINCGPGVMGPGWRANATTGRALRLILLNIGGAQPGEIDKSTQGMPGKYTFCIGEDEEESPWPALHVERGFSPDQSTVTVVGAQATTNALERGTDPEDVLKMIGATMRQAGCNNFVTGQGEPLVLFNPKDAKAIAGAGYSKDDVKRYLHREAVLPLEVFSKRCQTDILASGRTGPMIPMIPDWQDFMVVVAGGYGGYHNTFIPTFGHTRSVTVSIRE